MHAIGLFLVLLLAASVVARCGWAAAVAVLLGLPLLAGAVLCSLWPDTSAVAPVLLLGSVLLFLAASALRRRDGSSVRRHRPPSLFDRYESPSSGPVRTAPRR